jgi:hypothetical protein
MFAAWTMLAQDIGYLDLTDPFPRQAVRSARHFEAGTCSPAASPETTVTLMRLDKDSYAMGEQVTFEVKIENSGKETIEIPWTPHLGDLEPLDAMQSYSYRSAAVVLALTIPESGHYLDLSSFSYGSLDLPGSTRELQPGRWLLVKARGKIDADNWWSEKFKESTPLNVKATAALVLSATTYSPDGKGGSAVQKCLPMNRKTANQLDVTLWPRG